LNRKTFTWTTRPVAVISPSTFKSTNTLSFHRASPDPRAQDVAGKAVVARTAGAVLRFHVNSSVFAKELASDSIKSGATLAHRQCFQNRNAVVAGWQWRFHAGAIPVAVRVARAIGHVATDAGPAFVANTSSRSRVAVSMATAVDLVTWTTRYVTPVTPPSVEPAIANTGLGAVALKTTDVFKCVHN